MSILQESQVSGVVEHNVRVYLLPLGVGLKSSSDFHFWLWWPYCLTLFGSLKLFFSSGSGFPFRTPCMCITVAYCNFLFDDTVIMIWWFLFLVLFRTYFYLANGTLGTRGTTTIIAHSINLLSRGWDIYHLIGDKRAYIIAFTGCHNTVSIRAVDPSTTSGWARHEPPIVKSRWAAEFLYKSKKKNQKENFCASRQSAHTAKAGTTCPKTARATIEESSFIMTNLSGKLRQRECRWGYSKFSMHFITFCQCDVTFSWLPSSYYKCYYITYFPRRLG